MTRSAAPPAAGHTVWLLDANVLIALTHAAHLHHQAATTWFSHLGSARFATCALTQLALLRLSCLPGVGGADSPGEAMAALQQLVSHPQHDYWDDSPAPSNVMTLHSPALVGHRQITDAYLLGLALQRQQGLATLDRGLGAMAQAQGCAERVWLIGEPLAVHEPRAAYVARAKKST